MKRKIEYPMGSVSHGTMRNEDLIPEFLDLLVQLARKAKNRNHLSLCKDIKRRMKQFNYYTSNDADIDLYEILFPCLDEYAAPYFYFGSHPGDGSDYGYWISEDLEYDFEGLKVSDLSEVPAKYAGEILLVNDHGNISLYRKARTQEPREIWSIV